MNRTKIAIIDYKIDELISKKKYIDFRLSELYEEREDLITEEFGEPVNLCGGCK